MTPTDLTSRVTRDTCALGAVLAGVAACVGGEAAAVGSLGGTAIALGNFRWLAARAASVTSGGTVVRPLWMLGAGLRLAVLAAAYTALLATGLANPVALVAGLSVLPCALVGHGLLGAREESGA